MRLFKFLLFTILYLVATSGYSQKLLKGIVVDSASLINLSGVNIKVKHTNRGTSTNAEGIFMIVATEKDTLEVSYVGYAKMLVPVYLEDETLFVRLREESLLLKEVVIKDIGFHLNQKYTKSPTLTSTKPLKAGSSGGIGVNFSYFSKLEKEKRKLVKIMADNEKVKIYLSIVNDPDVKSDIMDRYAISEEKFYDLLSIYNEKNKEIMYSSNSGLILNSLVSFFQNQTAKK